MTQATRNVIGVVVAVVAGYIALAIAATADSVLSYPRSSATALGEILLRITALWPFLLSAAVLGIVAALIVRPPRPRAWLLVVGTLAAARYALALRYVAPDWQEWLQTIIAIALIGAIAAYAFSLVAHRRGSNERDTGGPEPG
jgi:hypothetical protein